ncbi:MAG: serine/threonine protein kinase [Opitutae bacterium]|nr:serine/threonine protein kinase [Opitutae bacterium]
MSPEKADPSTFADLPDAQRAAAFALSQWCGGKVASLMQLNKSQLGELVKVLRGLDCFFFANQPNEAIEWRDGELAGVSEHLDVPRAKDEPEDEEEASESEEDEQEYTSWGDYDGPPITVEGSTNFLLIKMSSESHPRYIEAVRLFREWNFVRDRINKDWWWLRDRRKTFDFLASHRAEMQDYYQAEFTENFLKHFKGVREAKMSTAIQEDGDFSELALTIEAGKATPSEIDHALAIGQNFVESGGKVYLLPKSKVEKFHLLQRRLAGNPQAPLLGHGKFPVSKVRVPEAEEMIAELDPNFKPPETWKALGVALRDLSQLKPAPLSQELDACLRPYQKIGVAWMLHLFTHKLGGILADEMGLGKTVQALALIEGLQSQSRLPGCCLVVCPASLVENWRREAERFCPRLKTFAHHGNKRLASPKEIMQHDLVITSYGTLKKDLDLFSANPLRCIVGDEAQHIKNRRTQNAKALASLRSRGRILLTGTPVENSITDLLSLLDFLMPGGWKKIPAECRGEERAWHEQRILKQAAPYILRREKKTVAPELPEKIEQVVYLEMTEEQRRTYEAAKASAEREIAKVEEAGGSEGAIRMKTLTQLLRLRQTCCDPRLLDENLDAETSAKLAAFREILQEAIDGGHRILLFSQFVQVLTLLRQHLDEEETPYCYIDGSSRDRMAQVDRFQGDSAVPLFLISLKAGGTGLNLTAADMVIHFDPWWNPAVEAQATDRAHRIGQSRVVTSYKLIVAGSVEEKVLHLQNQKRKLLQDVFEAGEAANLTISVEDLKQLL